MEYTDWRSIDPAADPLTPHVPLTEDQRGISRPQSFACDIGAYERVPPPSPVCGIGPELALLGLAGDPNLTRRERPQWGWRPGGRPCSI